MFNSLKQFGLIALTLAVLISFSGCVEELQNQLRYGEQPTEKNVVQKNVETPVLTYDAEKIVYYTCNDSNSFDYCLAGLTKFASFSEEFIHCQLLTIDEPFLASKLIELKNADVSVKVLFDRGTTYTSNDYPREDSQYGFLLRNLVDVQNDSFTDQFCVSEKGVLIGSFIPSTERTPYPSSFYVIYSEDLSKVMNKRFFEKYDN